MYEPSSQIRKSLEKFNRLAENTHYNTWDIEHNVKTFVRFLDDDPLVQAVLPNLLAESTISSSKDWWEKETANIGRRSEEILWDFPEHPSDKFALFYCLIRDQANSEEEFRIVERHFARINTSDVIYAQLFFTGSIFSPFCNKLSEELENFVEQQELQVLNSMTISHVSSERETRIFLSHKSENKNRVRLYHRMLQNLGFDPWLDDPDMPAGTELNRGILAGVNESCAVVFFITEDFVDERILSDEIDYAKTRKVQQGSRFAIITLKFPGDVEVPELLKKYVYKPIDNDLDGLYEIVRALPIELGPVRWKETALR